MCNTSISSVRVFLVALLCFIPLVSNISTITASQGKRQDKHWAEIERLYERGWIKRDTRNFGDSEKSFRQAAHKLEQYRSYYIKDRNSLSFFRVTYMLGNFNELGNLDNEAQKYYGQALIHPLANSIDATLEAKIIAQEAKERLSIVEQRLRGLSTTKSKDYPRISIKGGSKGGHRDLPKRDTLIQP
jgi:hypothetical protein